MVNRPILARYCMVLAAMAAPGLCLAQNYKDDDTSFSLRLPAALTRFSTYADVAGVGGSSAGSKWLSSVNPASTGWLADPNRTRKSLSAQYSGLCFSEGTKIHVSSGAGTLETPDAGAFQPAFALARSNRETTRDGLGFLYELEHYQFQYGKRFGKGALGAAAIFSRAEAQFDLMRRDLASSVTETYGLRLGGLLEVREKLLTGLVFDYAVARSRSTSYDVFGLGIGDMRERDTSHQFVLRPGLTYEYLEDSAVLFDYQFGAFCDGTGRLFVHRFSAGVDHRVVEGLFVRAGATFDARGEIAWTTGVGIYPNDWLTIDIAYQDRMFPELAREFGASRTVTVSVSLAF